MRIPKIPTTGIVIAVIVTVAGSFVCDTSFRKTISRRLALGKNVRDLTVLCCDAEKMKEKIAGLQRSPAAYESLVRRELGYLRPGEKEVRFVKKDVL